MAVIVKEIREVQIDEALLQQLSPEEEGCTIIHCSLDVAFFTGIRIWPTTYLVQEDGSRRKLIKAFHISLYPNWLLIYGPHRFTLVFERLGKDCRRFDLLEDIPEPGGFHVPGINRNNTDVYHLFIEET